MGSLVAVASPWVSVRGATTIETITEIEEFARLRGEWDQLLEHSDADCMFLTWPWLFAWWKHLSEGRRLSLITVRRGSELVAIAPLAVSPPALERLVPFRSLQFLGTGSVGSDYLDIIVRRGREEEALEALALDLGARGHSLELRQVARGSSMAATLARRLARHGWQHIEQQTDVCPFGRLEGTWSDYLASLELQQRHNFNRRFRKLNREFTMRFERAESEAERRRALGILFDVHERRWRERGGSTAFYTPALLAFHEEWSRLAFERGWLRLFVVTLNDTPVAATYGVRYRGTFSFYQTGFDPRYAQYGVGQVTLGLAIQRAIEEGATEFDLLHGDERYKFDWTRQVRELGRIELYPPTVTGQLQRRLSGFGRTVRHTARQALDRVSRKGTTAGGRGATR